MGGHEKKDRRSVAFVLRAVFTWGGDWFHEVRTWIGTKEPCRFRHRSEHMGAMGDPLTVRPTFS